jgi:rod shape-determining protein MreC
MMRTRGRSPAGLSRGQTLALVLLFILTSSSFIMLDRSQLLDPFKRAGEGPAVAVGGAFAGAGERARRFGNRFGDVAELRAENERLRAENAQLRAAEARVKELERENEQLTAQANFAVRFPQLQQIPARVISRDPRSRSKYFVINRGAEDGVQVGMAAVSPDFLVGLVTAVEAKTARVTLIVDESIQVGVQLQDDPRTQGILYGQWQKGGRLTMEYVERNITVPPNARIITSGLTQRVPKGLLVGVAANVKKDEQQDYQEIEVLPLTDFDGLESVTIILNPEQR